MKSFYAFCMLAVIFTVWNEGGDSIKEYFFGDDEVRTFTTDSLSLDDIDILSLE